jgi:hypothetical protein
MFAALVRDKNNRKRGKLEHHGKKRDGAKLISRKVTYHSAFDTMRCHEQVGRVT